MTEIKEKKSILDEVKKTAVRLSTIRKYPEPGETFRSNISFMSSPGTKGLMEISNKAYALGSLGDKKLYRLHEKDKEIFDGVLSHLKRRYSTTDAIDKIIEELDKEEYIKYLGLHGKTLEDTARPDSDIDFKSIVEDGSKIKRAKRKAFFPEYPYQEEIRRIRNFPGKIEIQYFDESVVKEQLKDMEEGKRAHLSNFIEWDGVTCFVKDLDPEIEKRIPKKEWNDVKKKLKKVYESQIGLAGFLHLDR